MKLILGAFLTLNIFAACSIGQTTNVPFGDNPVAGKYYNIRGINMYCEIYGSGPPLLMIHGNNGSIKDFEHNIEYFAERYRVIVADSRAQGKSKDTGESITFEMMADDAAALLDALNIKSAFVIGWSDGGINALLLAMRHPEKVIKLAVTGANISPDASAFAPGAWEPEKKYFEANNNKVWETEKERNDWKLFLLDWNQPNIPLPALHSIKCPSLIICGDHDVIAIEHTVSIFQNIPQAQLWVLPDSDHATLISHADDFNKNVDAFFTKPFQALQ